MDKNPEKEKTNGKEAPAPPLKTRTEGSGILYVGIDLGTSRTSIASSNGVRETVLSMVGWPKDAISRKLLQKEILFGNDVLNNRLSLNYCRPFEKGVIKYTDIKDSKISDEEVEMHKKAAKELVKHAISIANPPKGVLVYGVLGTPAQASMLNKQSLIEAAKEALDAVMIVSEPFAVAYGLNLLEDTLVVDIGAGTTDLCRMHGTMPEKDDQITFGYAGDNIDEMLYNSILKRHPDVQLTINMAKQLKEKFGFVSETTDAAIPKLLIAGKPTPVNITEELKEACKSIVPGILESAQKLIATFDPEFQHRLRNNIMLAGGGSQMKGLDWLIEKGMEEYGGAKVNRVDEPVYAGANGALKLAYDMPEEFWEELR
ncbi:MAG: rod shape-determining protein [Planctomycetes bacterium]|nr:rod shape-determining protein [Planctomycetota bacterium]